MTYDNALMRTYVHLIPTVASRLNRCFPSKSGRESTMICITTNTDQWISSLRSHWHYSHWWRWVVEAKRTSAAHEQTSRYSPLWSSCPPPGRCAESTPQRAIYSSNHWHKLLELSTRKFHHCHFLDNTYRAWVRITSPSSIFDEPEAAMTTSARWILSLM